MKVSVQAMAIVAAVLLSSCAGTTVSIRDEQGRPVSWQFPSQVAGKSFLASVPLAALVDSPDWDPADSIEPPVLASEAVRIAWVESRVYLADPTAWEVASVDLQHLDGRKWVYVVQWQPKGTESSDRLQIPVLLSGHALPLEEVKVTTER